MMALPSTHGVFALHRRPMLLVLVSVSVTCFVLNLSTTVRNIISLAFDGVSISVERSCAEDGDKCLYIRKEVTLGADYTTTMSIHLNRRSAVEANYSATRIECSPETIVRLTWDKGVPNVTYLDGSCTARGEGAFQMKKMFGSQSVISIMR